MPKVTKKPAPKTTIASRRNPRTVADVNRDQAREMEDALGPIKGEGEQRPDPTPVASIPTSVGAPSAARTSTAPTSSVFGSVKYQPRVRPPHVIVRARAGTGKTTTLIEGLKLLRGLPTSITPSPQQRAVWDAILQSRDRCRFVGFVAFNSSIADELKRRVPPNVDAKTMHGLGYGSIRKAFSPIPEVDESRCQRIVAELLGQPLEELKKTHRVLLSATEELAGLCKMNLYEGRPEQLDLLCDRHEVSFDDPSNAQQTQADYDQLRQTVYDLVPLVLDRAKDVAKDNTIDYDDMVWLPVVLNLRVFRFDLLLVDEAQDLNRCQQELAKRAGERLIFVGDDRQAIYGFTGADSESMDRLYRDLEPWVDDAFRHDHPEVPPKCIVLPLTVTRRCGRAIVAEARRYVSDFEAHETNPAGEVREAKYTTRRGKDGQPEVVPEEETYLPLVKDGDMVVCRSNAPLVAQYFKFLKRGQPAYVRGRKDVAKGIAALIAKTKAETVPDLIRAVTEWRAAQTAKEMAKATPSEAKLLSIGDRADCVLAFAENCDTVRAILDKVQSIFSDATRAGVQLSSIHKAKGLEADRVFLLSPGGFRGRHPRQQDWEWQQELNVRYVAVTRAIKELTYVF